MFKSLSPTFLLLLLFMAGSTVMAQADASTSNGRATKEELPKNIKETLAKQRIEREKKDYEDLLQKSEEAVKLSQELEKSFNEGNQFSGEDIKKLERLEKLVKKIRSELGGSDDKEFEENNAENPKISTLGNALVSIQSSAEKLFDEIKKSTRYSISVVAIQSSNTLLKILKIIRFRK
jgi:membrane-associated HD superfamily phosphohydrolase